MTSRFVRSRKSRSTCGARSAMSSTGSPGSWPMSIGHDRAVGLRHAADERQRPVHPLVVLQAAVRDRVEQRDVEALAERLRLELEAHRIVVRVDDAGAAATAARVPMTNATIVRSRLTAYQRDPGSTSAFAGDAGHGLKPAASTSFVASRTNVIALFARPMNCLKSSPKRITWSRSAADSFGQTGPGCALRAPARRACASAAAATRRRDAGDQRAHARQPSIHWRTCGLPS